MASHKQIEDIVNNALKCRKEIPVGMAVHIFLEVMEHLAKEEEGPFHYVKEELGSRNVEHIIISIIGSYVGSLYTSVNFSNIEEAVKYAKEQGMNEVKIEGNDKEDEKEPKCQA